MLALIQSLQKEIHGNNQKEIVLYSENILAETISEAVKENLFFTLPLENILRIISKVDFTNIEASIEIIKTIINKTINAHSNEKETIFLLQSMETKHVDLTLKECIEILSKNYQRSQSKMGRLYQCRPYSLDTRTDTTGH